MNPEVAFAVYALAAVVFALPVCIAVVFAYEVVVGVVAAVRHFTKPAVKTVEIITPVEAYVIPTGMTFEQFDAWLSSLPTPATA